MYMYVHKSMVEFSGASRKCLVLCSFLRKLMVSDHWHSFNRRGAKRGSEATERAKQGCGKGVSPSYGREIFEIFVYQKCRAFFAHQNQFIKG